jgi:hypothetical protein
MTRQNTKFIGTYFGQPYEGQIKTAKLSLRFDYQWTDDLLLDISIDCEDQLYPLHDDTVQAVRPSLSIDSLVLASGLPRNGDFRNLQELDIDFHQPDDPDGGRLYEDEAPGTVYFCHHHQIDDLKIKLRHLGRARFHVALSGSAEDQPFDIETVAEFENAMMLHRGTAARAPDMDIEISQAERDAARARGDCWIEIPEPTAAVLSRFARFLRVADYDFVTKVDVTDLNVDVIAWPRSAEVGRPSV